MEITHRIKAFWKKLLSYRKTKWSVADYPLYYKNQTALAEQHNVGILQPWTVQIINWWVMTGIGDTKQDAYENLKSNFQKYTEINKAPRPGTHVPLIFADSSQIEALEDIAPHFFENILDLDYYECFISDESSLSDFGKDDEETLQKINRIYGLSLGDLSDASIVGLLKTIKQANG